MNKFTKIQLMRSAGRQERRDGDRRDYDRPDMRDGYSGPESRFRDRDGREHYDNGRYAPMNRGGEYSGDPMDRGGYGYPRSAYMEPYSHYPMTSYVPPVYQREDWQIRKGHRPMNKIGFSVDGEMERLPQELGQSYSMSTGYKGREEMSRYQGDGYSMGQSPRVMPVFNRQMAEEWMSGLKNEDGTRGPHWSVDQAKQVMAQCDVKEDIWKFWAALNAVYSDLAPTLKRLGITSIEAYVDIAKAFWLDDKDAVDDKLAAYYTSVVKH